MTKKILILLCAICLNSFAAYNSAVYMKVVDVQGNVKLEVDARGSTQAQKKMVQKPARLGDLLFTRDSIITESSSLTAYLQNKALLKVKENSSLYLDNTYDKNGNIILSLHRGEIIIVSPMSGKSQAITIYTPDNSTINISGSAIVSYNQGTTRVQFLHGYGRLNGNLVGQFTEVNTRGESGSNIVMNSYIRNRINEILGMQYINTVAQANIYRNIARLSDSTVFNVKQMMTPPETEIELMREREIQEQRELILEVGGTNN